MSGMARSRKSSHRPQTGHGKAGPSKWQRNAVLGGGDISRVLDPAPRIDTDVSGQWFVQYISATSARKTYVCPGCRRNVAVGSAHYVVWKNDHLFGKQRAIEERRHWHLKCWDIR